MIRTMSITKRYQVTVPKEVRDFLGLHNNSSLIFNIQKGKVIVKKAPSLEEIQSKAQRLMKKRGVMHVTDEEIDRAREIFDQKGLKW